MLAHQSCGRGGWVRGYPLGSRFRGVGPLGGGSGRIERFKGAGSFLGQAGGKVVDDRGPNPRRILGQSCGRLACPTIIVEDLNGSAGGGPYPTSLPHQIEMPSCTRSLLWLTKPQRCWKLTSSKAATNGSGRRTTAQKFGVFGGGSSPAWEYLIEV